MKETTAADCFAALGHETRLAIFRALVRAGDAGAPVGALQETLGVPGSTLTHHIQTLTRAGLVQQQRDGRVLTTKADYGQMRELVDFLTDNCCQGLGGALAKDDAA
ncbi:metalloregulator ArsR/SmtB family transcription factor [Thalassospiraceae bacterium LMO-JJ14]|nr:metalloregulator ArsR/SmtB family transcription factor [Thalassospiraceae bacterium LMO-JJ14]